MEMTKFLRDDQIMKYFSKYMKPPCFTMKLILGKYDKYII